MKGKYGGRYMTIYGHILPGAVSLANWAARTSNVSEKAKQRLKVIDWLRFHNNNISLTARRFGLIKQRDGQDLAEKIPSGRNGGFERQVAQAKERQEADN